MIKTMANKTILHITIVAPAGKSRKNEAVTPTNTDVIDTRTATTIAPRNPFAICRAVTAGKINKAEANMIPTTLIANTTVRAVREAVSYTHLTLPTIYSV